MASGFRVNGVDLDSVFAPWHTGWAESSVTEFEIAGGDINQRYAVLAAGTAAAATGLRVSGGADLNTVFAAYGTTGVQVLTQPGNVSGSAAAGNPSGTVTTGTTTCAGTKGKGSYTYTWYFASGSGATFTAGSSATTAVTGSVPAGQTISGTMYCTIADGTSSVNTATRTWSIQNTTPPITVIPYTVNASAVNPNNAGAAIIFLPTGIEEYQINRDSPVTIGAWDPSGDGSNYDVMAALVSGTAPNTSGFYNTLNTWVQVTGSLGIGWSITNAAFDGSTMTCVLTISLRLHSTQVVQSSGSITLNATSIGKE